VRVTPLACFFLLFFSILPRVEGATVTWDGGGSNNNWSTDNNWNPNADPAVSDVLIFTGGTRLTNNIDTGGGITLSYGTMFFQHDAQGSFLIGGGTVTNRSNIFNNSDFLQQFTNTSHILLSSGTTAQFSAISNSLFFSGSFSLEMSGHLNFRARSTFTNWIKGDVTGTVPMRLTSGGINILSGNNSGFSGAITNEGGNTLVAASATALGTGNIILEQGTLRHESANQRYNQSLIMLGTATNEVASGLSVHFGNAQDEFTGSGLLVKTGAGTLILSNTTSHTGGISINQGTVEMGQTSSLGTGTVTLDGGELFYRLNVPLFSNAFHVASGGGTLSSTNGTDLQFLSSSLSGVAGATVDIRDKNITANQHSIGFSSSGWVFSNDFNFVDANSRFRMDHDSGTNTFAGAITGSGRAVAADGTLFLVTNKSGVTVLQGNNSFSGAVSVLGGTLIVEANNALGSTASGTLVSNGTLAIRGGVNYSTAESLDLFITNSGVAFRSLSGNNTFAGAITNRTHLTIAVDSGTLNLTGLITNGGNHMTLSIASGSTLTNTGIIRGAGAITKSDTGTWVANAGNLFSGGLTNLAGTIESRAQSGLGTGTIVMGGGSLSFQSVHQTNSQSIVLNSGTTISVGANLTNTLSGAISGTGSLTKSGNGATVLSGNNTFSGAVTNSAGVLIIDHANGLGTSSSVAVEGGTLLFNRGFTNTSLNVRMNGGTLEELDASVSVGTLTMAADSVIDLQNANATGRIRFASATNLTGTAVLTIYGWTGSGAGGTGDLIFFTNSSAVTSSFLSNVQFAGGLQGATLLGTGELVPITPEPGTLLGGGGIFALLLFRRFRRKKPELVSCPLNSVDMVEVKIVSGKA
jgi:fibronectin-binding autotransporter adhesin